MRYLIPTIFTLLFTSLNNNYSAQKAVEPTIFTTVSAGQTKTLTLDVSNYNSDAVGQLKDDLIRYYEKVIFVDFNENEHILSIRYNEFMLKEDFMKIFDKYGVNYYVKKNLPSSSNNLSN